LEDHRAARLDVALLFRLKGGGAPQPETALPPPRLPVSGVRDPAGVLP